MIVAFEHDKNAPAANATKSSAGDFGFARQFWQPEPKHVHRRGGLNGFEAGETADDGKASIGANRQFGTKFVFRTIGAKITHADDSAIFFDQVLYPGLHHQFEFRILRRLASDETQKMNLGNHCNVGKARFQPTQIEWAKRTVRKLKRGACNLAVRNLEQLLCEPDLVENLQDGRMNSVTAKISVEILMHFEESHGNPAAREEKSKHSACGPAADDATRS